MPTREQLAELAARTIHAKFRNQHPDPDPRAWDKAAPAVRHQFLLEGEAVVDAFIAVGVLDP